MSCYQEKKLQGIPKGKKTQFQESEQVSEPYKAGVLGLSYQEFKKKYY